MCLTNFIKKSFSVKKHLTQFQEKLSALYSLSPSSTTKGMPMRQILSRNQKLKIQIIVHLKLINSLNHNNSHNVTVISRTQWYYIYPWSTNRRDKFVNLQSMWVKTKHWHLILIHEIGFTKILKNFSKSWDSIHTTKLQSICLTMLPLSFGSNSL